MEREEILNKMQEMMEKAIEHMQRQFSTVRTGSANPSLVENISVFVESYGSTMRLKELAVISSPEVKMLLVQPFDPSALESIEKAINESNLGITPVTDGNNIRLPIPDLTEERRKEFVKVIKGYVEDARVQIRTCRKSGMDGAKNLFQEKSITEDEKRAIESEIQKATDSYTIKVEKSFSSKEKEILRV